MFCKWHTDRHADARLYILLREGIHDLRAGPEAGAVLRNNDLRCDFFQLFDGLSCHIARNFRETKMEAADYRIDLVNTGSLLAALNCVDNSIKDTTSY